MHPNHNHKYCRERGNSERSNKRHRRHTVGGHGSSRHNFSQRIDNCPNLNVNMYFQQRNYVRPTYHQYGPSSTNYVQDTYDDRSSSTHYHSAVNEKNFNPGSQQYHGNQHHNYSSKIQKNNSPSTNKSTYSTREQDAEQNNENALSPNKNISTEQKGTENNESNLNPVYQQNHGIHQHNNYSSKTQITNSRHTNKYNHSIREKYNEQSKEIASSATKSILTERKTTGINEEILGAGVSTVTSSQSRVKPKKRKKKRTLSERKKQMRRERAAKHQEGLRMKAAAKQNSPVTNTLHKKSVEKSCQTDIPAEKISFSNKTTDNTITGKGVDLYSTDSKRVTSSSESKQSLNIMSGRMDVENLNDSNPKSISDDHDLINQSVFGKPTSNINIDKVDLFSFNETPMKAATSKFHLNVLKKDTANGRRVISNKRNERKESRQ